MKWKYTMVWRYLVINDIHRIFKERKWEGISCGKDDHINSLHSVTLSKNGSYFLEFFHVEFDCYSAKDYVIRKVSLILTWEFRNLQNQGQLLDFINSFTYLLPILENLIGCTFHSFCFHKWDENIKTPVLPFSSSLPFKGHSQTKKPIKSQGNEVCCPFLWRSALSTAPRTTALRNAGVWGACSQLWSWFSPLINVHHSDRGLVPSGLWCLSSNPQLLSGELQLNFT